MNEKEVRVSELSGAALDWAVAIAVKHASVEVDLLVKDGGTTGVCIFSCGVLNEWLPSTDWSQGGPLIDAHDIDVWGECGFFCAHYVVENKAIVIGKGSTRLIAACRAIVSAKLGDTVSVPVELLEVFK